MTKTDYWNYHYFRVQLVKSGIVKINVSVNTLWLYVNGIFVDCIPIKSGDKRSRMDLFFRTLYSVHSATNSEIVTFLNIRKCTLGGI